MKTNVIYNKDCLIGIKELPDSSIDLLCTDPPYGIKFMGKSWDKALPDVQVWREALRVLKPGAFAFVMCIPRQDCLARMIVSLEDAGFNVSFSSIFHCFAQGFPKAMSISKVIDKQGGRNLSWFIDYILEVAKERGISKKELYMLFPSKKTGKQTGWLRNKQTTQGITLEQYNKIKDFLNLPFESIEEAEREIIFSKGSGEKRQNLTFSNGLPVKEELSLPATPAAKSLDGSYGGFQPKPAVEVIIVAMKPLSEKTYVDQALANRHGISWLDDCRVPYKNEKDYIYADRNYGTGKAPQPMDWDKPKKKKLELNNQGRFPANLLCSDDVLNDGKIRKNSPVGHKNIGWKHSGNTKDEMTPLRYQPEYGDSGSFSRYFSLDAWWEKRLKELPESVRRTFPFLIVPKASKAEKNRGCEGLSKEQRDMSRRHGQAGTDNPFNRGAVELTNSHPTVKPLKLMSYLITLGSRPGDLILDPFAGSGTTLIAAKILNRHYIGYDTNLEYCKITKARLQIEDTLFNRKKELK